jgi:hypothetical protein
MKNRILLTQAACKNFYFQKFTNAADTGRRRFSPQLYGIQPLFLFYLKTFLL